MQRTGFNTSREYIGRPAPRGYTVHDLGRGTTQRFASYFGAERRFAKVKRGKLTLTVGGLEREITRVG